MTVETTLINCAFNTEEALYLAYMPFIKGGGIFIRTKTQYALGNLVHLSISIMNEPDNIEIDGKIVWITPKGAQGNKPAGIGVQFIGDNSRQLCNKIETHLTGMLKSTQVTDTI